MTRNLKVLGLALVAILAMSAVAASAASAKQDLFTSDSNAETVLTGTTDKDASGNPIPGEFLSQPEGGAKVSCKHAEYKGVVPDNSEPSVTVHPKYKECEGPGGAAATVTTDGCNYILTGSTHKNAKGEEHATTQLECTTGKTITVAVAGVCTLHFGTQSPKGDGVTYTHATENSKNTVTVHATVSGISFSKTGGFCFLVPGGTNGVLKETIEVTGYQGSTTKPATEAEETSHDYRYTDSNQVNITVDTGAAT